jgi:hypothetical protein
MLAAIMAQEPPDVAWAPDDELAVGAVVGEDSEVLVVELPDADFEVEDPDEEVDAEEPPSDVDALPDDDVPDEDLDPEDEVPAVEVPVFPAVDELDVAADPVAAFVVWGSAARAAKSPTPASEPTATRLVAVRLRRSQASRSEGDVIAPIKTADPQNPLGAGSTLGHNLLGSSWE